MRTFDHLAIPAPTDHSWYAALEGLAASQLHGEPLPDTSSEEWRYSQIELLDPTAYGLIDQPGTEIVASPERAELLQTLKSSAAAWIELRDGHVISADATASGVTINKVRELRDAQIDSLPVTGPEADAFDLLNLVLSDGVAVRVEASPEYPIVIIADAVSAGVSATQLLLDVADGVSVEVIEVRVGGDAASLSIPWIGVATGVGAELRYSILLDGGPDAWTLGRVNVQAGQNSTVQFDTTILGGRATRMRTDLGLDGADSSGLLTARYLADTNRDVDLRTFQTHRGPATSSNLEFRGVAAGEGKAVYTGLIRIEETAPGTDANQTNRVLKLGENAWADSVPNLEIHHNDVKCSHASAIGPIDEDQRFYLESRGIPTEIAERLIVTGFLATLGGERSAPAVDRYVAARVNALLT